MCCIAGAVECAALRTGFRDMITEIYGGRYRDIPPNWRPLPGRQDLIKLGLLVDSIRDFVVL